MNRDDEMRKDTAAADGEQSCCRNSGEGTETAPCGCAGDDDDEEGGMSLSKLILSAVLFAAALTADHLPVLQSSAAWLAGRTQLAQGVHLCIQILYFAAYLFCGLPVVKNAVRNILHGKVFDEQFLMTVASLGALFTGETAEAVAVMLFYQIGEFFQDYAVGKSKRSISALMAIRPDRAFVVRNGETIQVKPEDVAVGETIIVRPGERVPLDGVILTGTSFVDTSALTGESVPREVAVNAEVLGGFVNTQGVITVRVTKPAGESAVTRILNLVQNASSQKAKSEQFITRFAKVYTPVVCALAVLVAVIPPVVLGLTGAGWSGAVWQKWFSRALLFLVVSCPCALVISVPLSFFGGIGAESRSGVLVKGSDYLERLAHAQTAVFDKTGTLTKGVFVVTAVHPVDAARVPAEELIAVATHAEYYSNHPISRSLKDAHHCERCDTCRGTDTEEVSGQGLKTTLDGKRVLAGNMKLMENQHVTGFIPCTENDAGTIVHVAVDGVYAGHIVISDEPKDDAKAAIASLKKLGVKQTVMLTGDSKAAADKAARELGVDTVFSELLPGDKVARVEDLLAGRIQSAAADSAPDAVSGGKARRGSLLFVGDGINDAPVLARADVGIAMGALGSDAAIEAADVVIMTDEVSKVPAAVRIARRTMRIVNENIVFALAVKVIIMVLGTFGFADMWAAVFGDVGVTFIAVLNALRLLASPRAAAEKSCR